MCNSTMLSEYTRLETAPTTAHPDRLLARVYLCQSRRQEALLALEQCTPVFQRLDAALDLAAVRTLQEKLST